MIYLDYAATTPIREEALHVFHEASKKYFGNPSSLHEIGTQAKSALEMCRTAWAKMIQGHEEGVFFTGGGSESNQLAIWSILSGNKENGHHIITTDAEHSSLYNVFQQLETQGYEVTYLSLKENGQINLQELKEVIKQETVLASIHYGNPEIGVLQPIAEIGNILKEAGVIFHTDCVQAFGNIPIDVKSASIDALSISSHKLYGPKGTGVCYIEPHVLWQAQVKNTSHERGFRAGTVDVPSILAATTTAQLMMKEMEERCKKHQQLRVQFLTKLKKTLPQVEVVENKANQLVHIIGLLFPETQGQHIMLECSKYGIAISTGSACQVGMQDPSRTMLSLGKTADEAKQFVRISFGNMTTNTEVNQCVQVLERIMQKM